MTAAGPWSVKGIDPRAREIAKDLARRSGLTLGEWLNQIIIEGDVEAPPFDSTPGEPADRRQSMGQVYRDSGTSSVEDDDDGEERRAGPSRDEVADIARIARALETLSSRMEAAEHRSTLAISGIDQSVLGVLSRLEDLDHEQSHARAGIEESLGEIREGGARLAQRVGRLEQDESPRLEALKALEHALTRLSAQINEGEARTGAVAQEAHEEIDLLSRRLHRVETAVESSDQTKADIELIGTRLKRVETAFDSAEQTRADVDFVSGRLERVEGSLGMAEQTYRAVSAVSGRVNRLEAGLEAAEQSLTELNGLPARMQSAEASIGEAPARYADAEKVDAVLSRMVERLDRAESRTTAAFESLESSFAGLDARLRTAESRLGRDGQMGVEAERRFQNLAAELAEKVEAARAELSERIRTAANTRLDRLESTLGEISTQVQEAEQRSAQAIDAMGREVVRIAENLGERVTGIEGGLAEVVQENLKRSDTAQAAAIERLGEEIARIAESLNERISSSEERANATFEGFNAKFDALSENLAERHDRTTSELADRIRQSEERTAQLLAEARERIDQRRSTLEAALRSAEEGPGQEPSQLQTADDVAVGPATLAAAYRPLREDTIQEAEFEPAAETDSEAPIFGFAFQADAVLAEFTEPDSATTPEPVVEPPPTAAEPAGIVDAEADPFSSAFDASDEFEAPPEAPLPHVEDDPFAPPPPASDSGAFSVKDFAPAAAEPDFATASTRDMIEQARAAARRASGARETLRPLPGASSKAEGPQSNGPLRAPFGLSFPNLRKREGGAPVLRTVLLASGTAAAITAAAIGAYSLGGANRGGVRPQVAEIGDTAAPDAGSAAEPNLAVALRSDDAAVSPGAVDLRTPDQASPADTASNAKALYEDAVHRIESGDTGAVKDLREAADAGYPDAQFYLGRLYEAGSAGLDKDLVQARRWTERAADGGNASAMYNLASYLYAGEGGAKDATAAAEWFRRAAERGVVNSQYNLAQLYEKGYGVPQNQAEAYKWYLVAAASGDQEAKANADALKRSLPPDAQAAAERSAATIHAQASASVQTASAAR